VEIYRKGRGLGVNWAAGCRCRSCIVASGLRLAAKMGRQGQAERQSKQGGEAAARRPTGLTDKALLTPEELRQKLK